MIDTTRLSDELEARQLVFKHACQGVQLAAKATLAFARELLALGEEIKKTGDDKLAKRYEAIGDKAALIVESYPETVNYGLAQQMAAVRRSHRELLEQVQQITEDEGAMPI